jgi:hypothetical protein
MRCLLTLKQPTINNSAASQQANPSQYVEFQKNSQNDDKTKTIVNLTSGCDKMDDNGQLQSTTSNLPRTLPALPG